MEDKSVFGKLKDKGEEVFNQISGELVSNPLFMRALERAMQAKKNFDRTATHAIGAMNLPSRRDVDKLIKRLDAIEMKLDDVLAAVQRKRRAKSEE